MKSNETRFAVILPAAGSGSRSGQSIPKQYVELAGRPVLAHTIAAFAEMEECAEIVIAVDDAWRAEAERCAGEYRNVRFVAGGRERQHSIANALASIANTEDAPELVLVHDAARPCVSRALIERVLAATATHGAAIPALPINETVKRVDADGVIIETIPRADLRTAQTPQGFRRDLLEAAYTHARSHAILGTDDASLVEAYGGKVWVVEGEEGNIKITVPHDFERAARMLGEGKR